MTGDPSELWKTYVINKSPEIKEKLVVHYISLLERIANKTAYSLPNHLSKEDLIGYGVFGLLEAIDRFNPEMGIPFNAFASKRIKGAIIDGLRKEDWVPVSVRKKARLIEQAYHKLELIMQRNVTDEEIAAELNISQEELNQWLRSIQYITIISLDEPLIENEGGTFGDNVPDTESPNPVLLWEKSELKQYLIKAVGELPEKEKLVISLYYYQDLSNKEIANVLELSDSRVSQLHTKAIFRLRGKLARVKKNL